MAVASLHTKQVSFGLRGVPGTSWRNEIASGEDLGREEKRDKVCCGTEAEPTSV